MSSNDLGGEGYCCLYDSDILTFTRAVKGLAVGGSIDFSIDYREYNPDSAGTQRDECLVGDSRRQVLVDGDKGIEVVQE